MVYEKQLWKPVRPEEKVLYSWDDDWEYRFTDVFPVISRDGSRFALTEKQLGNSSIVSYNMDGSDPRLVFNAADLMDVEELHSGTSGAYQPDWSPDGEWIVFGLGVSGHRLAVSPHLCLVKYIKAFLRTGPSLPNLT